MLKAPAIVEKRCYGNVVFLYYLLFAYTPNIRHASKFVLERQNYFFFSQAFYLTVAAFGEKRGEILAGFPWS